MTSRRLRWAVAVSAVFASVGFFRLAWAEAMLRESGRQSSAWFWSAFGVLTAAAVATIALAQRGRREGCFTRTGRSWRNVSLLGGAVVGVWATKQVVDAMLVGGCNAGLCGLVVLVAPIVFVLAFASGALATVACVGALSMLRGLPVPTSAAAVLAAVVLG